MYFVFFCFLPFCWDRLTKKTFHRIKSNLRRKHMSSGVWHLKYVNNNNNNIKKENILGALLSSAMLAKNKKVQLCILYLLDVDVFDRCLCVMLQSSIKSISCLYNSMYYYGNYIVFHNFNENLYFNHSYIELK